MPHPVPQPDPRRQEKLAAFDRLLTVMDDLRAHCPWDKKQTTDSLRHLTIEETFELAEAIINADSQEVKKEVGDLMLHLVFYSKIASEKGDWDVADMLNSLCDKLIERHPHIYGDVQADTEEEVKRNWEAIKLKTGNATVLGGVPKGLPAMVKAMRIQEKARGAGFDWEETHQVWDKVQEELAEFGQEFSQGNLDAAQQAKATAEFGDVLFSLINFARFAGINPEEALERTNQKFIHRFNYLEAQSKAIGKPLTEMTLAEMEHYWQEAKTKA